MGPTYIQPHSGAQLTPAIRAVQELLQRTPKFSNVKLVVEAQHEVDDGIYTKVVPVVDRNYLVRQHSRRSDAYHFALEERHFF